MNDWLNNQIIQMAILYYNKNISQKGIGEIMGLSKTIISRMLQKAKDVKYKYQNNIAICDKP